jgi:ribosomal-protein-alanine N-acetyltransferase
VVRLRNVSPPFNDYGYKKVPIGGKRILGGIMIKLLTERLLIRDYIIEDLESHHELLSDEIVMYYLQDIKTENIDESKENLLNLINDQKLEERKYYCFRIENRSTSKFIGSVGYTVIDNTPYGKLVHMGYFIKQDFWNKGYATEALKRVIEYAFDENSVYRIHTGCHKENIASEKVMQKCGFIKEAEFKEYVLHEGKLKDRVEYRLLKHEWGK